MKLSTIVIETIFTVIYFPARKTKIVHTKNGTAKRLCLTLLQSETLGKIHLNTLYEYLASGEDHLASTPVWATSRVTAASHCAKSSQKGGAGRSLLQELEILSSLKVGIHQTPTESPDTITQCSTMQLRNTIETEQMKGKFFRSLSVNQNCEVTEFHSYTDKNTYYKRQISRGWKLDVYLQALCLNNKIILSLSEPILLDITTSK